MSSPVPARSGTLPANFFPSIFRVFRRSVLCLWDIYPIRRLSVKRFCGNLYVMNGHWFFFEAPHRIKATLKDMYDILGDRQMVMVREMTKVFEEVRRGSIHAIMDHLVPKGVKGEFTLVVSGKGKAKKAVPLDETMQNRIKELLVDKNMRVKEVANLLSNEDGLPYRAVYRECLAKKRQMEGI